MRPTREEIVEAREWLGYAVRGCSIGGRNEEMIRVLLAATAPPDGIPRPDDMAELARLVAAELRDRGIGATEWSTHVVVAIMRPGDEFRFEAGLRTIALFDSRFENLNPCEIADVIQAEERKHAREWAGDE